MLGSNRVVGAMVPMSTDRVTPNSCESILIVDVVARAACQSIVDAPTQAEVSDNLRWSKLDAALVPRAHELGSDI